jgi:hypothetical protein
MKNNRKHPLATRCCLHCRLIVVGIYTALGLVNALALSSSSFEMVLFSFFLSFIMYVARSSVLLTVRSRTLSLIFGLLRLFGQYDVSFTSSPRSSQSTKNHHKSLYVTFLFLSTQLSVAPPLNVHVPLIFLSVLQLVALVAFYLSLLLRKGRLRCVLPDSSEDEDEEEVVISLRIPVAASLRTEISLNV